LRISLVVGVLGVVLAGTLGITLGLIAGYVGGAVDIIIMRIADVQLTFPAILIALLVNGVAKSVLGNRLDAMTTLAVLVAAIGLSTWVHYARTVRGSVMVEKNKDYVAAAQLIGLPQPRSFSGTCCRTRWDRSSSSPPSIWGLRSSPKRRCRSSAPACPTPCPRSVP